MGKALKLGRKAARSAPARVDVGLAVVVCRQAGRALVLLTRRRPDQVLGGYWEFPGGKVEPGERPMDCAIREAAEEVGLAVHPTKALPVVEFDYDHAHVRLHAFLCETQDPPRNVQVTQHQWKAVNELSAVRLPAGNAELVAWLVANICGPDPADPA